MDVPDGDGRGYSQPAPARSCITSTPPTIAVVSSARNSLPVHRQPEKRIMLGKGGDTCGQGTALVADYEDEARLHQMGYKQELKRGLSLLSNFGIAFTILSIPTSLLPFIYFSLFAGGPRGMLITWPIVSFFSLLVGLSMSEIVSTYPTSGGLYYWSAQLAGPKLAPIFSFFTGWYNFLGQWALTSATAFVFGQQFAAFFYITGIFNSANADSTTYTYKALVLAGAFICIMVSSLVNSLPVTVLDALGRICLFTNVVGLIIIIFAVGFGPGAAKVSLNDLINSWANDTGYSDGYAAYISILAAALTYTGYDSAAHLAEETGNVSVRGPRAILGSIVMCFPIGWITIGLVLSAIPPAMYDAIASSPATTSTVVDIFVGSVGHKGAIALNAIMLFIALTCTYSLQATHMRQSFAFSRDHGLPFSAWLHYVDPTTQIPIRILYVLAVLDFLLLLPLLQSLVFFSAINSIGVTGTYICYSLPIGLRFIRAHHFPKGPFNLGWWGIPNALISLVYLLMASVALILPTENAPLPPATAVSEYLRRFNWAPAMVGGLGVLLGLAWVAGVRDHFKGPKIDAVTAQTFRTEDFKQAGLEVVMSTAECDTRSQPSHGSGGMACRDGSALGLL
ncbi:hypothetical protein SeMB42_g01234 [Synchytrium endobioticum]|uniref:Amino acid permease/ SLC12A domain-containing protein n=1 Tax=Synchytrium endobioticum TaxID=286115 RepID=A0A507DLW8_9FUNG|nr:hypothetical protein SeLEV6574_g00706 [Synchytrium endobioticum]TPX52699.1 hypothetical protein SeMB42_g01234 [Synchytrium endobioticum]